MQYPVPQARLYEWTTRQRKFYELWKAAGFMPDKKRECMTAAGFRPKTNMTKVMENMQSRIRAAMVRQGANPEALARVHVRQLNARNAAHPEMDDNTAQLRALDMAYELFGAYPAKKLDINEHRESVAIEMKTVRMIHKVTGEDIRQPIDVDAVRTVGPDDTL